jgi:hypothetical protein
VTKEQLIVLGFIATAFVVGWAARALTGERRPPRAGAPPAGEGDERTAAVDESRRRLEDAIDAHEQAVALASDGPERAPAGGAPLAEEVAKALESDSANELMLGAVSADRGALTDLELDLADWGFTYGVAWALARERRTGEGRDAVAREALSAAEPIFREYAGGADWTRPLDERVAPQAVRADGREATLPNGSAEGRKARRRRLFRSRR